MKYPVRRQWKILVRLVQLTFRDGTLLEGYHMGDNGTHLEREGGA